VLERYYMYSCTSKASKASKPMADERGGRRGGSACSSVLLSASTLATSWIASGSARTLKTPIVASTFRSTHLCVCVCVCVCVAPESAFCVGVCTCALVKQVQTQNTYLRVPFRSTHLVPPRVPSASVCALLCFTRYFCASKVKHVQREPAADECALARPYVYVCTSKASKLSIYGR
jgi:hypothetical protein